MASLLEFHLTGLFLLARDVVERPSVGPEVTANGRSYVRLACCFFSGTRSPLYDFWYVSTCSDVPNVPDDVLRIRAKAGGLVDGILWYLCARVDQHGF